MSIDLNSLSRAELEKLRSDIDKALASLEARRKADARKAAEQAAKEFGFSLDEILGKEKPTRSGGVARYRNPANPKQTWTGRGRQPGWIKEGLAAGKSVADFAI